MLNLPVVYETEDHLLLRGRRLDTRLDLIVGDREVRRNEILARFIGSGDLLYDQIITEKGKITLIQTPWGIDYRLRSTGYATYSQSLPQAPGGFNIKDGEIVIEELANQGIRIHKTPDGSFGYDLHSKALLGVFGSISIAGNFPIQLSGNTKKVTGQEVMVQPNLTGPRYHVTLPGYDQDEIYADYLRFEIDQVVGSVSMDIIDGGIRGYMKENGVESVSVLAFFRPNLEPYKQVIIYHGKKPKGFSDWKIPCICDQPREEFHLVSKKLDTPSDRGLTN